MFSVAWTPPASFGSSSFYLEVYARSFSSFNFTYTSDYDVHRFISRFLFANLQTLILVGTRIQQKKLIHNYTTKDFP